MNKLNFTILLTILSFSVLAQNYLQVSGKNIVDGNNQNFIIRSIGTGNWMLQEGYMMQSSDVAPTQHQFRAKLIETIGETKTDEFYEAWLANHFTKADVDSMAKWGFNAVRVAMHYKWFTLPIEEEPVQGENTWLDKGFTIMDNLLDWCEANEMYLILDMHGAPGGQGKDAAISDYDASKPSLWESNYNKAKLIALWKKLAQRYANEPWIGGYDLINETNWTFPEGNNSQMRTLYIAITNAIREVDENHIIYIEGNSFANDFSGLTPAWDDNMVYSFHKYWSYNDEGALDWVLNLRNQQNRPIWLGETGENSNTWFANLVKLCEKNNVGWSWWPVKKSGINNVMFVETPQEYKNLIEMWKGNGTITETQAFNAVMAYAEAHKIENCEMRYDVIDALIRQPQTTETKPFKHHTTSQNIFMPDYDLGRNNYAYFDTDTANYHLNTNEFKAWNTGWTYRNDGVDIESCSDTETNGYSIGWTNAGEWLQYTIESEQAAAYDFSIRTASQQTGKIHLEVNGKIASESLTIPATGGWSTWKTTSFSGIILPQGKVKVKFVIDSGTANLNYFSFSNPQSVSTINFKALTFNSDKFDNKVFVDVNKEITSENITVSDFMLIVNSASAEITDIAVSESNNQQLIISTSKDLLAGNTLKVYYNGTSVKSGEQNLENINLATVTNNFEQHAEIPGKIEAEDYLINSGFQWEDCSDTGGGQNSSYSNNGDYLEYFVYVADAGNYQFDLRVASLHGGASVTLATLENGEMTNKTTVPISATGGWQSWQTKSVTVNLPKGKNRIRLTSSTNGEFNMNWIQFSFLSTGIDDNNSVKKKLKVFPNPTNDILNLNFENSAERQIELFDMRGTLMLSQKFSNSIQRIDVTTFDAGIYFLRISENGRFFTNKICIK